MPIGTLYVTATPIGNLEDITHRAVRVLSEADVIAAEDTRHTRILLAHYGITTKTVSCHKFNEAERLDYFMGILAEGGDVALVSDAGTPCVSDPGGKLVARAAAEGIAVVPVCGPSAVAAVVSVAGLGGAEFRFAGFLPRTEKLMREKFCGAGETALAPGVPCVFYESPKRVGKALEFFARYFPGASVCLCNDLTKKFEKIYRGTPGEVLAGLQANPNAGKGEYAGVISVPPTAGEDGAAPLDGGGLISPEAALVDIMVKTGVTLKEAVRVLHGRDRARAAKKEIYGASLRLKGMLEKL